MDQHVAATRERLQASDPGLIPRQPHREDLADYALGFLDELDWREPVESLVHDSDPQTAYITLDPFS